MASRDLNDLHPVLKKKATEFLKLCSAAGIDVLIYCTFRSKEEQAQLYAIGRTRAGKKVTNAKPGQSKHNFEINRKPASKAFDFVPLRQGKPVWNNSAKNDKMLWTRCGEIGESIGLEWAGRWTGGLKETAHLQLKDI